MTEPDDEARQPERRNALEYAGPTARSGLSRSSQRILWCALALVAAFGVFSLTEPFLPHSGHEMSAREICRSNMHDIGLLTRMYAWDHGGRFPDDLPTLLEDETVDPRVFVCPLSGDTPARGPTTQATAASLRQHGHCSYIYLGKGLTDKTVTPDMVLLYEPLSDHEGDGMNVLFGDFHVQWVPAASAQKIIAQHTSSTQPIRLKIDTSSP